MKNSILFSLACLTLVLSGCFNRSTKVWDLTNQVDPNDIDGDGIENACDVDYIDGPVIDSDRNGEIDTCQPDTDGDGLIDAVDRNPLTPLNGGTDLNGCSQYAFTLYWIDYADIEGDIGAKFVVQANLAILPNEDLTGMLVDYQDIADAQDRMSDNSKSLAGELREQSVVFNLDGDCLSYGEYAGAAQLIDVHPGVPLAYNDWNSSVGNYSANIFTDFDGDGIDNDVDPSVDLKVWSSLAEATDGMTGWSFHQRRILYYFQVALIQELIDRGLTVNLITSR